MKRNSHRKLFACFPGRLPTAGGEYTFLVQFSEPKLTPEVIRLFSRTTSNRRRTCPTNCAASTWRRRWERPPRATTATPAASQRTGTASSGRGRDQLPPHASPSRAGMLVLPETLLQQAEPRCLSQRHPITGTEFPPFSKPRCPRLPKRSAGAARPGFPATTTTVAEPISLRHTTPLRPTPLLVTLCSREVTPRRRKTVRTKARVSFPPVENRLLRPTTIMRPPNQQVKRGPRRPTGKRLLPTALRDLVVLTLTLAQERPAGDVLTNCSRHTEAAPSRTARTLCPRCDCHPPDCPGSDWCDCHPPVLDWTLCPGCDCHPPDCPGSDSVSWV